ncbi:MAG: hypothetical protein HY898_11565 [Deltaproteobacteria bacterium]|nr:hypothetical protein [Deltaproteobacteria bacterium]
MDHERSTQPAFACRSDPSAPIAGGHRVLALCYGCTVVLSGRSRMHEIPWVLLVSGLLCTGSAMGCIPASLTLDTPGDASDPDAPCSGKCPKALATNQDAPLDVVTDGTRVYWTTAVSVMSCAVGGCEKQPTTLATAQAMPMGIAVSGQYLYWTSTIGGQVMACDVEACNLSPSTLVEQQGAPRGIGAGASALFWANSSTGQVMACANGLSCTPKGVAVTQNKPWATATVGTVALWINQGTSAAQSDGEVINCDYATDSTCIPKVVASGQPMPVAIAVDASRVYWANQGAGTDTGQVLSHAIAPDATPPTVLADNQASPASLALDSTRVYWTNSKSGEVMACELAGCNKQPTVIASGQTKPWGVAVDEHSVYWTDLGHGRVYKIAK